MSRVVADLVSRSLLCFGIAAAVGGLLRDFAPLQDAFSPTPRAPAAASAPTETVTFGVVDDFGDITPTEYVPLVPGQQFGWQLDVGDQGLHTWREVLITPAAPREWVGNDLILVDDGKVGITERTEVAIGGSYWHAWTITDGDPAGQHVIELWLDGRLVKRVPFVIVAPR